MATVKGARDHFYEKQGRPPFTDWRQCFQDLEQRVARYADRAGSVISQLRSYLEKDGRIPGPLVGETFRQLDLKSSQLDSVGTVDLARALCFFIRLEGATTALNVLLPPFDRGECVHAAICLQQDATGGRLATFSSNVKFPDDTPPELSPTAEYVDVIHGIIDGTRSVFRVDSVTRYSA